MSDGLQTSNEPQGAPLLPRWAHPKGGHISKAKRRAEREREAKRKAGRFNFTRDNFQQNATGLRLRVFMRDEGRCVFCGAEEWLTLDHIVPVSRDGPDTLGNLQTLCDTCNQKKADSMTAWSPELVEEAGRDA